jgi:hypothetical protein
VALYTVTWPTSTASIPFPWGGGALVSGGAFLIRGNASANWYAGTDFSKVLPWAGMRRCNFTNVGDITYYYGDPNYDDTVNNVGVAVPLFYSATEEDTLVTSNISTINGEVVTVENASLFTPFIGTSRPVAISDATHSEINLISSVDSNALTMTYPLLHTYVSGTVSGAGYTWSISDNLDGEDLPPDPMFVVDGDTAHPKPHIILGAFPSVLSADGTKLESRVSAVGGERPHTDTAQNLCTFAQNRGGLVATYPPNLITDTNAASGLESGTVYDMQYYPTGAISSSTFWAQDGTHSLEFVTNPAATSNVGPSSHLVATTGAQYTASLWINSPSSPSGTPWKIRIYIREYNAGGTLLLEHQSATINLANNAPTRYAYTVTFTQPTTAYALFGIRVLTSDNLGVGAMTMYLDDLQFEVYDTTAYPSPVEYIQYTGGGYATPWHLGAAPIYLDRPATGWGIMTLRAYAGIQCLALMEFASWTPTNLPPLQRSPASTSNLAYVGRTGSFGTQLGSTTGIVPWDGTETTSSGTTSQLWGHSYRGLEFLFGFLPTLVDGAIVQLNVDGTYHLLVSDYTYNWEVFTNYTDTNIQIPASADTIIGDWALFGPSQTQNWFLLPGSLIVSGRTSVVFNEGTSYPSPVVVGSGAGFLPELFGARIGQSLTTGAYGARLQFTPV